MSRSACVVALILSAAPASCTHRPATPREAFSYRIEEYVELRRQAERAIGGAVTSAPASAVDAKVERLAAEIQRLRAGLPRGVMFSGDVAAEFRRALATRLAAPDGAALRRALGETVPHGYTPTVNGRYPDDQPVQSMPPSLLSTLPPLPPALAYRFVGTDLLLLDRTTRVVVDWLPDALPR